MDKFSEAAKNFFKSAILMLVCGICFLAMGKTTWGIGCVCVAVAFVVIGFSVAAKDKDKEDSDK